MRGPAWLGLLVTAAATGADGDAATVKYLFLNRSLLAAVSPGVQLTLHPPTRAEEPALVPEHPWESYMISGMLAAVVDFAPDEKRLYYNCCERQEINASDLESHDGQCRACLAVSKDGRAWHKPNLGLVSFQGSKDNNILPPAQPDHGPGAKLPPWVLEDVWLDDRPGCPEAERWKALYSGGYPNVSSADPPRPPSV